MLFVKGIDIIGGTLLLDIKSFLMPEMQKGLAGSRVKVTTYLKPKTAEDS